MRWVVAIVVLCGGVAHADRAGELTARGEDEARRGDYAGAIESFRAADRLRPRAHHACLIGLAYLRRQLWVQAEVYLARCERRASASDPVPPWFETVRGQLAASLAGAAVMAVDLRVAPHGVAAAVRVPAFGPDGFEPQVIHLPVGTHVIEVSAPGFRTVEHRLEVTGAGARRLDVVLARRGRSGWSIRLLVGGGVAAAGAAVLHALAVRARGRLDEAPSLEAYRRDEPAFDRYRIAALALYGVAAAGGGIGLYLRLGTDGGGDREAAVVGMEWRR